MAKDMVMSLLMRIEKAANRDNETALHADHSNNDNCSRSVLVWHDYMFRCLHPEQLNKALLLCNLKRLASRVTDHADGHARVHCAKVANSHAHKCTHFPEFPQA